MTPQELQRLEFLETALAMLLVSDRYTFQKHIQMFDGRNIQTGRTTGTKIGTASDQKLGFYGLTPVIQPSSTGETNGATTGAGNLNETSTFTGNFGSRAYTILDIVKNLKTIGILKKD